MKLAPAFFFFFIICYTTASAQYQELVDQPYHQRLEALDQLSRHVIEGSLSPSEVQLILDEMRHLADHMDSEELRLEADLLEANYDRKRGSLQSELLLRTLDKADQIGITHVACRAAWSIGQYHWLEGRYEQGFQWYIRLDQMMEHLEVADFPDKAIYLEEIGRAYYRFGDYEKAISYFEQVVELPIREFYLNRWRHANNTMGLSYRQLNQLDLSDACFQRLLDQAAGESEQWVGIASGNLGENHFIRGDYDRAIPLLEEDIRIAELYDDLGLAAGSHTLLAAIAIQHDLLTQAKTHIDQAYAYVLQTGQTDRLRTLYPVMSKWHAAHGQHRLAAEYLDSALLATKNYTEKFNALKLMRADQEITASRQEASLRQLQDLAARQRLIRNTIIGGLLLALLCTLAIYRMVVYRNRVHRQIQTAELARARQDLDTAQRLLEEYTRKIHHNSQIIQSMEGDSRVEDGNESLHQLRSVTILTDEDWQDFRQQFQKVYPGMVEKLTDRHPDLTEAEIRYLLLLRLNLSRPEIAHALGISPASLRVTWHRLRKKLGLSADHQPGGIYSDHFADL